MSHVGVSLHPGMDIGAVVAQVHRYRSLHLGMDIGALVVQVHRCGVPRSCSVYLCESSGHHQESSLSPLQSFSGASGSPEEGLGLPPTTSPVPMDPELCPGDSTPRARDSPPRGSLPRAPGGASTPPGQEGSSGGSEVWFRWTPRAAEAPQKPREALHAPTPRAPWKGTWCPGRKNLPEKLNE